jgi:hypothetical protein
VITDRAGSDLGQLGFHAPDGGIAEKLGQNPLSRQPARSGYYQNLWETILAGRGEAER